MKFLCDRCKTRYAIADERVRGKILKIRCKNCSAVITVREGMDDSGPEALRSPMPTQPAPIGSPPPPPAAAAAPAGAPPPAALDEEWYVSKDGHQEGPFTLTEAQAWVAARGGDEDLHCWNEGFDDWLPVEKVSHFRGLRSAPRTRAATRPGAVNEPEPQPLFAATLAAMEAEAAADAAAAPPAVPTSTMAAIAQLPPARAPAPSAWRVPTPTEPAPPAAEPSRPATPSTPAVGVPALPRAGTPAVGVPALPRAGTPAVGVPALPKTRTPAVGVPALPRTGTPLAGVPALPRTGTPLAGVPALPRTATPPGGVGLGPQPAAPAAAHAPPELAPSAIEPIAPTPRAALPTPFGGGRPVVTPAPSADAPAPAPMFAPAPAPAPMFAPVPVAPAPAAAHARFDHGDEVDGAEDLLEDDATASGPAPIDEDDLDIGEVSRVVRLADLMAPAAAARPVARAATASVPAIGGTATVSQVSQVSQVGRSTGASPAFAPASAPGFDAETLADLPPVAPPPPRRHHGLYLGLGLGAIALIVIAAIVLSGGNEDTSGNATTGGNNDFSNLGYRPNDPLRPSGGTAGTADPGPGTAKVPTGSGKRPTGSGSTTGTGSGTAATVKVDAGGASNPNLRDLSPDDVFTMSARMETGTRRCYERAMKADPFLKVTKIKATITVSAAGPVTEVRLSDRADHPLGICLAAAIKRWPFPPSKDGIVSEFALVFEQK
ncbi:MAG: zinc-ribbon domain-containing protein [Myxococcales bacterium]|nr:zinc-ribbon domain-containing protein [Myxococcales bacterium]